MAQKGDDNPLMDGRRRGPNWTRVMGITLCVILGIVAAGCGLIYYFGNNLISLSNYVADEDVQQLESLPEQALEEATEADALENAVKLDESEISLIHEAMEQTSTIDTASDEAVFNFLLVGVDRRDKTWNGNSDSMMLVSINDNAQRVSVISLMRDTYVDIPGHGYAKLNAAYALGGGPLLTQTITDNYRIEVSNYAAIDFENMIELVDALGGVELTWTDKEVEVANGYILDMCNTLGIDGTQYQLPGGGTYLCNGVQTVAYARNRFVGNSDYQRTERQRYVITQMINKIKTLSVTELTGFVTTCLPLITHNFEKAKIWDLVKDAPTLLGYTFVKDRVPYDGLYEIVDVNGQGMLVPDWSETIEMMHRTIYGDGAISSNYDNDTSTTASEDSDFTTEYLNMMAAAQETATEQTSEAA